ncbi:PilZ domain-containing protein [Blastochloris sulfoviridis]|uniref:PilZ domain-containing protein n=1 Tax=Blastochloris sulfoviridis TaxID=50712 RepID=A0A5M6I3V2_9HYPH|nr:PilZ domain-containing protein [Blastochloris sulfoviridis]KAA5602475.1 PilZ domain-containing protein [Blastochloris sulfoviridis]
MFDEKRRSHRRDLQWHAYVVLEDGRRLCRVSDISDLGAFLKVEGPADIPESFVLQLTVLGPPCRSGRVMWRDEQGVGVEWTGRVSKAACADGKCTFDCPGVLGGAGGPGDDTGDDHAWL